MGNFNTKRADAIRRKNEAYSKAEGFDDQSEILSKKRSDVADSKSRIPDNLPTEIKTQIDAIYEQREKELGDEASVLADEIKNAHDAADKAVYDMLSLGDDLGKKADKLSNMKNVPLVGSFLEGKSRQLADQQEQMYDLAEEMREYADRLANSRSRLLSRPKSDTVASSSAAIKRKSRASFVEELYGGQTLEQQSEFARRQRNTDTSDTTNNDSTYGIERERSRFDD